MERIPLLLLAACRHLPLAVRTGETRKDRGHRNVPVVYSRPFVVSRFVGYYLVI